MKDDDLYQNLLNVLKTVTPGRPNIATTLADILCLGKEAIYRRLRGDVPFTFHEVALICHKLNISFDSVIGTNIKNSAIFHIDKNEYIEPDTEHYESFDRCLNCFRKVAQNPESELGSSGNVIPFIFTMRFPHLLKFKTFKWMYQQKSPDLFKAYAQIQLPEKLLAMHREHGELLMQIKNSSYTWDNQLFADIINDIKYYNSINVMSDEEVSLVKEEMLTILYEIEQVASKGRFANGNKIQIYLSHLHLDTNYTYIESNNLHLSLVPIFTFNALASFNPEIFIDIRNMVKAQQRFSTLISETGEIQRVQFFEEQRKKLEEL